MEPNYRMEKVVKKEYLPAVIMHQILSGSALFVSPHWHKEVELNLMLMNKGYFIIDGKRTEVGAGDINVINSGVIHSGYASEEVLHQEMITILWDYDFFLRYYEKLPQYRFNLEKDQKVKKEICDLLIHAALLSEREGAYSEMKLTGFLYYIGGLLLEHCLEKEENKLDYEAMKKTDKIREIIKYIDTHYKDEITLELMARHMNVAPTYFSKKFRQVTGIRFYDYLIQCRVKNARDELLNTPNTITEVAYNNGFPSVKSFIGNFKKYYHTTPKQYSKRNESG